MSNPFNPFSNGNIEVGDTFKLPNTNPSPDALEGPRWYRVEVTDIDNRRVILEDQFGKKHYRRIK